MSGTPVALPVVVLNETAARRFWPGKSPIGRQLYPLGSDQGYQVVGVVGKEGAFARLCTASDCRFSLE